MVNQDCMISNLKFYGLSGLCSIELTVFMPTIYCNIVLS